MHGSIVVSCGKVAVVLIGTNNIGSGYTAEQTAMGTIALLDRIRTQRPLLHVVMMALLPRGTWQGRDATTLLDTVNNRVRQHIDMDHSRENLHFVDCGARFLHHDGSLDQSLMPDQLHPNALGATKWMECIKPLVDRLIKL